jgi:hypothetical protein
MDWSIQPTLISADGGPANRQSKVVRPIFLHPAGAEDPEDEITLCT